ncbi:MAG: hypothetical protein HY043_01615 [Verrucomicrobia bacterium]|nr:hypothetical protein [Verrucomicrobiota bacterium]
MNDNQSNRAFELGLLLLVPVIYTGLEVAGVIFNAAGHGTLLFCDIPSWPFRGGATDVWYSAAILWASVAVLMVFRQRPEVRVLLTAILLTHYSGWWIHRGEHDFYYVRRVWNSSGSLLAVWVSVYAVCQIILWAMLIRAFLKSPQAKDIDKRLDKDFFA